MHTIFLDWILLQKDKWGNRNILIENIIDQRINPRTLDFPYVAVQHCSPIGLGQIELYTVNGGYILEFWAGAIDNDEVVAYCCEFVDNPLFDIWGKKYIEFLGTK